MSVRQAIIIRRAGRDDVDMFRRIRLEALASEPAAFASDYAFWATKPDRCWRRELEFPVVCAMLAKDAVGMMALRPLRPAKMAHRAILTGVYIRREWRGSGLAAMVLSAVVTCAIQDGLRQIELGVRIDNERALRFYARNGFTEIGRNPAGFLDAGRYVEEVTLARQIS